ncbi:MAG: hypothetical protein CVU56_09405 [Deltaproteobacteria bacterium HGW-Deltaproteobacteria-14]|jgi:hypothetical protein|nr:MAG: hypothetical protein CVU56_09405 [Deltaproteobacteria bacterium HGW-Deltaproteobacteria-14]
MTEGESTTRAALRPGLIHRAVGGEVFVLMGDSTVHWLKNATAVALWRVLEAAGPGGATVDALVGALCASYEVTRSRAEQDVGAFLADLAGKRVIELRGTSEAAGGAD